MAARQACNTRAAAANGPACGGSVCRGRGAFGGGLQRIGRTARAAIKAAPTGSVRSAKRSGGAGTRTRDARPYGGAAGAVGIAGWRADEGIGPYGASRGLVRRGGWSGLPRNLPGPRCGPPRQAAAGPPWSLALPQAALPCGPHPPGGLRSHRTCSKCTAPQSLPLVPKGRWHGEAVTEGIRT